MKRINEGAPFRGAPSGGRVAFALQPFQVTGVEPGSVRRQGLELLSARFTLGKTASSVGLSCR